MGTLGHNIFEPLLLNTQEKVLLNDNPNDKELLLFMERKSRKSNRLIKAKCKQTNEGFVVLKGSQIEMIDSEAILASIKEKRQHANIDKNCILQEDTLFKSPTAAASFVIGGHINGLIYWKNKQGQTLKELESETL